MLASQCLANKRALSRGIFLEHVFMFQSAASPLSEQCDYVVTDEDVKE
jgi:hypothetical protein